MDTLVTITVSAESPEKAGEAIAEAFSEIKKIETLLNFWSPDSEVSAINKNAGLAAVKVSPDTLDIIETALFISEKTDGGFDATIGPVIRLYDFKNRKRPDSASIRKKLPLVNYKEMKIDKINSTAFLAKSGASFDTGGIAKGYGAERATETLKRKGIKAALIAVAGDIRAFGRRPDGKPWTVGIRNPMAPKDGLATDMDNMEDYVMAVVELGDEAVSTSGDYERFFEEEGKLYHHILNPKTGLPSEGVKSVSIISKNGAWSDGFSTGIFVMGAEEGMRLARELGLEALIVDSKGEIHLTKGLKGRVRFPQNNGDGK